ncbi:MAG: hypothetical protein D6806_15015 [Deltaproteobacteria bacterium]|nr:MAG: hypothetical protein D6806_15015 [Deltaproteobacteria bacterium]
MCRSQSAGGVPQCLKGCTSAADCDFGSPAYDADNYECRNGVCVYSGCNSDGECQASTPSVTTVCRPPT